MAVISFLTMVFIKVTEHWVCLDVFLIYMFSSVLSKIALLVKKWGCYSTTSTPSSNAYAHTYIHMYVHTHVCTYVRTCTHTHAHTHTDITTAIKAVVRT